MICITVMLAVFLGWPLAFGGDAPSGVREVRAAASSAVVAARSVPRDKAQVVRAGFDPDVSGVTERPESCYNRFRRENRACERGNAGAACRLKASDQWDLCEARGVWTD